MAKRIAALILLVVLLVAVGMLVYITRPGVVSKGIERQIEKRLEGTGRQGQVGRSAVDTNTGRITLYDIRITEPDHTTPFLTVPRLEARVALSRSAQGPRTTIGSLLMERPSIRIVKQGGRFNFSDLLQNASPGPGRLEVTQAQVVDGTAVYRDADQDLTVRLFGLDLKAQGRLTKRQASGTYQADRIEIVRQGRQVVLTQVGGHFDLEGDNLQFDLQGRGLGGTAAARGRISGVQRPPWRVQATLRLDHWNPATLWPQLQGRLTSTVQAGGEGGKLAGTLATRGVLRYQGRQLPHDLEAHWQLDREAWSFSSITGSALGGQWRGSVRLMRQSRAYQGRLQVSGLPLDTWAPALGSLSASVRFQGQGRRWQVGGTGRTTDWQVTLLGNPQQVTVTAKSPRFQAGGALLSGVRIQGTLWPPLKSLHWQAEIQAESLAWNQARWAPVQFKGSGSWSGGQMAGTLPFSWAGTPLAPTAVQITWQDSRLRLFLDSAWLTGRGTLNLTGAWPFQFHLAIPPDALDQVVRSLPSTPSPITIAAGAEGEVRGEARAPWSSWQAKLQVTPRIFKNGTLLVMSEEPVQLRWRDQTLTLEPMDLTGAAGNLHAAGTWRPAAGVKLAADGTLNLALLALVAPQTLGDAEGQAPFHLQMAGAPAHWQGEFQVKGGWLTSRALRQNLSQLDVSVTLLGDALRIERAAAQLEDVGSVEVAGQIRFHGGRPQAYALEARARRLYLGGSSFRGEVNADLVLLGEGSDPLLSGEVRVVQATYFRDFPGALERVLTPTPPPPKREAGPFDRLRLAVTVGGPGYLSVDNRQAQVTLVGEVGLRGTVGEPLLTGSLDVLDGSVRWQGRRYGVTRGHVAWLAGVPYFDVALTSQINAYRVSVLASGKPGDLAIELNSTPPLPSLDVLTLVATGQTREDLRNQPLAVAGILAPELLAGTIQTLEQSLGLDVLTVTPAPASTLGHLLIGKQLTERLRVELAQNLVNPLGRELRWHFQVTGNLGISVRQQSNGNYWITVEMERWIR